MLKYDVKRSISSTWNVSAVMVMKQVSGIETTLILVAEAPLAEIREKNFFAGLPQKYTGFKNPGTLDRIMVFLAPVDFQTLSMKMWGQSEVYI